MSHQASLIEAMEDTKLQIERKIIDLMATRESNIDAGKMNVKYADIKFVDQDTHSMFQKLNKDLQQCQRLIDQHTDLDAAWGIFYKQIHLS